MFRLIVFVFISGLAMWPVSYTHARKAVLSNLCNAIDLVRVYDRLYALGITVSSLVQEPLSVTLRASSQHKDGADDWQEKAAIILYEELPGSVRVIYLDDQTANSRHGTRIYPYFAFRHVEKGPVSGGQPWGGARLHHIRLAGDELSLFASDMAETGLPELLVRLGASLGEEQSVASVVIHDGQRRVMEEQNFPKWQRVASKMQAIHLFGDTFALRSIVSTGGHLTANIRGNGSGAEKVLKRRTCSGKQTGPDDYSTFSTVTVP